jgi:hypothetical protein
VRERADRRARDRDQSVSDESSEEEALPVLTSDRHDHDAPAPARAPPRSSAADELAL